MECRKLSRLPIIGDLNDKVPTCVIMEIADAHGISFNKEDCNKKKFRQQLIASILETPIVKITEIVNISQMQSIARFVNSDVPWNKYKLMEAFNYLIKFTSPGNPLDIICEDFIVGRQTPESPLSINLCVLYKICSYYNINTNETTSPQQMVFVVKTLKENICSTVGRLNSFIADNAATNNSIDYNIPQTTLSSINYKLLHDVYGRLNDISALRSIYNPVTAAGAISLAALNFFVDISKSGYPLIEYKILSKSGKDNYIPFDPWYSHWYKKNPNIFDLTLSFNPLFCEEFYEKTIIKMAMSEGYTSKEVSENNPYELLQLVYVSKTFYQGLIPGTKTGISPIVNDNIEDIPYDQLICYGQMDSSEIEIISISELIDLFTQNKNFSSPFVNTPAFSKTSINKLKLIAKSNYGCDNKEVSFETMELRRKLLDIITSIEFSLSNIDQATKRFISLYHAVNPNTKQNITTCLNNLLDLGMYMRGWVNDGDYPLVSNKTTILSYDEIAVNVTMALNKYESSVNILNKSGVHIDKLPLVLYKDFEYIVSTCRKEGLTIGDRINLVRQGNNTNNMGSCIRLSSNWLCSSAHKYIIAIGLRSPFSIQKLDYIS